MLLTDLPDLPVLNIFGRLPLVDLLSINKAYPPWEKLKQSACLCRRKMTILLGEDPSKYVKQAAFKIPFSDELINSDDGGRLIVPSLLVSPATEWSFLRYPKLNDAIVEYLARTFPNMVQLDIAFDTVYWSSNTSVELLLELWSSNLVSLKMWYHFADEHLFPSSNLEQMMNSHMKAINSLKCLKHLTLYSNDHMCNPLDLPILSQLEEFRFQTNDHNGLGLISDSLKEYAMSSPNLKWIVLNNLIVNERLPVLNSEFYSSRFYHISLHMFMNLTILANFTSLVSLKLHHYVTSVSQIAHHLVPLKQLIHLEFCFDEKYTPRDRSIVPQLGSIKVIAIKLTIKSHSNLFSRQTQLEQIFPNLYAITLHNHANNFQGIVCAQRCISQIDKKKCIHQMLKSFELCSKLRKVCLTEVVSTGEFKCEWSTDSSMI